MELYNKVHEQITALGNSPQEIRKKLIELGITGNIRSVCNCPIANYLRKENGIDFSVYAHACWGKGFKDRYDLPDVIISFIDNFDSKLYPELIRIV